MREELGWAPLVALLMLSACTLAPPERALMQSFPAHFREASPSNAEERDLQRFWAGFSDPILDRLMTRALAANRDLRLAKARLSESRALLGVAEAEKLPIVSLQGESTRSRLPEWQQPGSSAGERTRTVHAPGLLMNWELDLFGRARASAAAATAQAEAQALSIGAVQVAVAGELVSAYLSLRGLQQRIQVAEAALMNQRESLRIIEARLRAGRSTEFDLARARSLVASTTASIPILQSQVVRHRERIATLTGRDDPTLVGELDTVAPLPSLPITDLAELPVGTPTQLLRRRPDIAVAEREYAAATQQIGVALADRYPRLTLSGLLGFSSLASRDLGSSASRTYSLGANLTWTALDFGRSLGNVRAAEARAEQREIAWQQTVLLALEETEGALAGFSRGAAQATALTEAARDAERGAAIARKRLAAGSVDLLIVLDAERQALIARDQLVQAETGTATALVSVYRALGGGWSPGRRGA